MSKVKIFLFWQFLFFFSLPVLAQVDNARIRSYNHFNYKSELLDNPSVANSIKTTLERNLIQLEPRVQGHYAIRMWRTTGQPSYLYPILFSYLAMKEQFIHHVQNLHNPQYLEAFSEGLLAEKFKTREGRIRNELVEKHREFLFACELLGMAYQINSLGIETEELQNIFGQAKDYLGTLKIKELLLDSQIVRYYAPQAVSCVYQLKLVGLQDLEEEFTSAFKDIFAPQKDIQLDEIEYENKLYGLTHFIIAGSDFYQHYVSAEKYGWILGYFDKEINNILNRSRPDLIAEVGLCFKLCGLKSHRVVSLTQQAIREAFDQKEGLIAPKKEMPFPNVVEHLNVMAYLLLAEFEQLHVGPKLSQIQEANFLFKDGGGFK